MPSVHFWVGPRNIQRHAETNSTKGSKRSNYWAPDWDIDTQKITWNLFTLSQALTHQWLQHQNIKPLFFVASNKTKARNLAGHISNLPADNCLCQHIQHDAQHTSETRLAWSHNTRCFAQARYAPTSPSAGTSPSVCRDLLGTPCTADSAVKQAHHSLCQLGGRWHDFLPQHMRSLFLGFLRTQPQNIPHFQHCRNCDAIHIWENDFAPCCKWRQGHHGKSPSLHFALKAGPPMQRGRSSMRHPALPVGHCKHEQRSPLRIAGWSAQNTPSEHRLHGKWTQLWERNTCREILRWWPIFRNNEIKAQDTSNDLSNKQNLYI